MVAEFFHVDWTSRARRKIGVPVLHLLEHENFDEQAGGGEGITRPLTGCYQTLHALWTARGRAVNRWSLS